MAAPFTRVIVIVLDSVGIGELPDARAYGDEGSNTVGHIASRVPLNVMLKPREIAYHLRDSDAKMLLCFEGTPEVPMAEAAKAAVAVAPTCERLVVLPREGSGAFANDSDAMLLKLHVALFNLIGDRHAVLEAAAAAARNEDAEGGARELLLLQESLDLPGGLVGHCDHGLGLRHQQAHLFVMLLCAAGARIAELIQIARRHAQLYAHSTPNATRRMIASTVMRE